MDEPHSSYPSGFAAARQLKPSPELAVIIDKAGIDPVNVNAGQLRVWRSWIADDEPDTRVVFVALTVDQLASRVRFHVLYGDDDEIRATFSLAGCLLQLETNEIGLDVHKTMLGLVEELLRDFRWGVEHLQSVH